jgi:hypothetical protein
MYLPGQLTCSVVCFSHCLHTWLSYIQQVSLQSALHACCASVLAKNYWCLISKKKLVMSISAQAQVVRLKRQWLRRLSRIGLGASATSVITRTWSPASSRWKITTNDAEFANTNETLPCSCQALANCKMKLQNLQWSDNTPIFGTWGHISEILHVTCINACKRSKPVRTMKKLQSDTQV